MIHHIKRILRYFIYFSLLVSIAAIGFTVYLIWLQPKFYFPKPTGKYAVGTKTYHWIDSQRKETFYGNPDADRELMIKVWYPAQSPLYKEPISPYAPYLVNFLKKNNKLFWLFGGLSRSIYSYSQPNLLLASDKLHYPVIIFSHGATGTYDSNTAHTEELASHGFIVVGISHTYDSTIVQFPDGRQKMQHESKEGNSFVERRKQTEEEVEIRIDDVSFVLNQLELLAQDKKSIFYKRLDKDNIGIFGQSFGGSTAVQICRRESRVKAGVDLDGSLFGTNATQPFNKPFMFILAGNTIKLFDYPMSQKAQKTFNITSKEEEKMLRERYMPGIQDLTRSIDRDVYTVIIKNAGHVDFTNQAILKHASLFWKPLNKLGVFSPLWPGIINGFRVTEIVNAYLLAFFNKYLKGIPSDLLDSKKKKYAEVEAR